MSNPSEVKPGTGPGSSMAYMALSSVKGDHGITDRRRLVGLPHQYAHPATESDRLTDLCTDDRGARYHLKACSLVVGHFSEPPWAILNRGTRADLRHQTAPRRLR